MHLYTIREISELSGLSVDMVRKIVKRREIPHVVIKRLIFIDIDEWRDFIRRHRRCECSNLASDPILD